MRIDTPTIRRLLREGHSVVLVEQGQPPLLVTELRDDPPAATEGTEEVAEEEVQISSRWPKGPPDHRAGRSVQHERTPADVRDKQDQVLERLNSEILALKAQIEQEEGASGEVPGSN